MILDLMSDDHETRYAAIFGVKYENTIIYLTLAKTM